jgi:nitrite reductase/ring-hydroxylating ferredoxin subunit
MQDLRGAKRIHVEISMNAVTRHWPDAGETRIPYWVYTDKDIYQSELERIWYGEHWLYAGLEAEIPTVGSYRTTTLGERSVIVMRNAPNEISVLENRCRHRGVTICQARSGKLDNITCPYHQWSYDLDGHLGRSFRRGIKGKGGMSRTSRRATIASSVEGRGRQRRDLGQLQRQDPAVPRVFLERLWRSLRAHVQRT